MFIFRHFTIQDIGFKKPLFRYHCHCNQEFVIYADASKDLKTILLSLLEMVASKKVSGHGRDQALNLLSKNVPRQNRKEKDNSRTLFTIDHGPPENTFSLVSGLLGADSPRYVFICLYYALFAGLKKILKVCGQVPDLPDQLPLTDNTQLIASVLLNKLYDDLSCDPERDNFRDICDAYIK